MSDDYSNRIPPDCWTPTRAVYAYMLGRLGKGDAAELLDAALGPVPPDAYRLFRDKGWVDENGRLTEKFKAGAY